MKPEGNLGADALADANNAWWSVTAWQERGLMRAFVDSEPHLGISARLDHYCDEATFVPGEEAAGSSDRFKLDRRPDRSVVDAAVLR